MNKLKNIIIVAGGENTRFNEMNIFPKILLPTLNDPSILSYDCKLFENYNIYLIINDRYELMTKQYIKKNQLDINILVSHNHNGSANTIYDLINELPKEDILFVWSDLILDKIGVEDIENYIQTISDNNVIFTYDGKYRFKATNDSIQLSEYGNIPGIYYCKNLDKIFNNYKVKNNYDYLEIIKDNFLNDFTIHEYKGQIIEFRDLKIYLDYYKPQIKKTNTRFFNKMIVESNMLTKQCINKDYNHLIEREINWYNTCKDNNYYNIPTIYETNKENHFIKMEYLDGYQNIYEFIKQCNDEEFNIFMKSYLKAVENLHQLNQVKVDYQQAYEDFYIEFYDKVIKRCNNISGILYNYDENKLKEILNKAFNRIIELIGKNNLNNYSFTHGDLNGSNVMYNQNTHDIKFIDPRGYFGKTQLIGPASYDYAKIMYCLSGYDDFNNGNSRFTKDWYDEPQELRHYEFGENQKLYYIMVGIIWVALAEYISQDVFKANIAYRHGLKILNSIL